MCVVEANVVESRVVGVTVDAVEIDEDTLGLVVFPLGKAVLVEVLVVGGVVGVVVVIVVVGFVVAVLGEVLVVGVVVGLVVVAGFVVAVLVEALLFPRRFRPCTTITSPKSTSPQVLRSKAVAVDVRSILGLVFTLSKCPFQ